jgi:hypothetical protein
VIEVEHETEVRVSGLARDLERGEQRRHIERRANKFYADDHIERLGCLAHAALRATLDRLDLSAAEAGHLLGVLPVASMMAVMARADAALSGLRTAVIS